MRIGSPAPYMHKVLISREVRIEFMCCSKQRLVQPQRRRLFRLASALSVKWEPQCRHSLVAGSIYAGLLSSTSCIRELNVCT